MKTDKKEQQPRKPNEVSGTRKPNEVSGVLVQSTIKITDPKTGQVLLKARG